jgi:hypothetical protein
MYIVLNKAEKHVPCEDLIGITKFDATDEVLRKLMSL